MDKEVQVLSGMTDVLRHDCGTRHPRAAKPRMAAGRRGLGLAGGVLLALSLVFAIGAAVSFPLARWRPYLSRPAWEERRRENRRIVEETASRVGVSPRLLLAVAAVESGFDDGAVSEDGAVGLLQVRQTAAGQMCGELGMASLDIRNPYDNALVGATYLRTLLRRYRGDTHLALAAYHAGPARADEWARKGQGLPGPEVVEQFAFDETRAYVANVAGLAAAGGDTTARDEVAAVAAPSFRYARTVEGGDTLSAIAAWAGVAEGQIVILNPAAAGGRIRPGDALWLRPIVANDLNATRTLMAELRGDDVEIRILKAERRLEVRIGGNGLRTYRIGLGRNPVGHKEQEGDGRTPEGDYYVCQRLARGRFGFSLGVSYPAARDAAAGLRAGRISVAEHDEIASRTAAGEKPPWDTALGGAICVHGRGSGSDWTAGCIALDDDDMNELFALTPMGARVVIKADGRR